MCTVELTYGQLLLPGTIHCITTSPDGHIIGLGYTSGVMSTLDLRTGMLLASWKAHEADILDVLSCFLYLSHNNRNNNQDNLYGAVIMFRT